MRLNHQYENCKLKASSEFSKLKYTVAVNATYDLLRKCWHVM